MGETLFGLPITWVEDGEPVEIVFGEYGIVDGEPVSVSLADWTQLRNRIEAILEPYTEEDLKAAADLAKRLLG